MPGDGPLDKAAGGPTYTDRLQSQLQQARSELHHVDRNAQAFIQQRPFAAVFTAVAAGYLCARLASRY